ncbi:MAG: hypothetical protein ACI865_002312 [Flavobacteriaceae bacterium]|jgi:hypothetical protein
MKYLSIAMICLLFGACADVESKIGQKTTIEVDQKFDAGEVIKGEIINAKFSIKNTGSYPLIISTVSPSCSCTVPSYPEEPIQPGESGEIVAQVNTDKASGTINKTIMIVANTEEPIEPLVIHAIVRRN